MDRRTKAVELIRQALVKATDQTLLDIAAACIVSGWNQGCCEYTDAPSVYNLLKTDSGEQLWCPWCGKLHYDDTTNEFKRHKKLSALTEEQWDKARKLTPEFCPENQAEKAGLLD